MQLFKTFTEMLRGVDGGELVLVVVGACILLSIIFAALAVRRYINRSNAVKPIGQPNNAQAEVMSAEKAIDDAPVQNTSIKLGAGNFRCYVISEKGPDYFTTIEQPVGNLFMAETSLPQSGACYLVKEWATGFVEDYDPRMVEYKKDETPQQAYFATHWDIVNAVYLYSSSIWDTINPWWAIGILGVMVIIAMLVFGG